MSRGRSEDKENKRAEQSIRMHAGRKSGEGILIEVSGALLSLPLSK
jgi:hypothetical protein